MIYISIALVLSVAIIGYLVYIYLDQRQQELNNKFLLNTTSADAETIAAMNEQINKFNQRINDTWNNTTSIKQELDALKLAVALKR